MLGTASVQLTKEAVKINGVSRMLLCASVFYFRIPRELWRERLETLSKLGYNAVDVYFPWNYHEQSEEQWQFDGQKDAEAFLQAVREAGLWTVARPGPYICSEWDGGALPAYLLAKPKLRLRDNDPEYLRHVARWFDKILPILRRQQLSEGGSVIAVQLENELDFYGCEDPAGYIAALRDMALSHGISVPLIACAGQGGLFEASGNAEGVVPTCNFYPNDRDPEFEIKVLAYRDRLADRDYPLLVTETNRSHYLLRRLLSSGAKLLGPYLQVSGTDFGFMNGTNNWGEPLAFMTSDYDFGGMISPEGTIRPDAYEGKLLSEMIATYGESLAEAAPERGQSPLTVEGGASAGIVGPFALKLAQGGHLVFVHHVGDEAATVRLRHASIGADTALELVPGSSVALPVDLPLQEWNFFGTLQYATAELFSRRTDPTGTAAAFHADGPGEIVLRLDRGDVLWEAEGAELETKDDVIRVSFGESRPVVLRGTCEGRRVVMTVVDRQAALAYEGFDADGTIRTALPAEHSTIPPQLIDLRWTERTVDGARPIGNGTALSLPQADFLEKHGIYRGYAWYEAEYDASSGTNRIGWLLRRASDIISLYADGEYACTAVPGGSDAYIASPGANKGVLAVRAEIWGHTNFDDLRLPALRLHAMKGLTDVVAVSRIEQLDGNWRFADARNASRQTIADPALDDGEWPIVGFGGWLSDVRPATECFRRTFRSSAHADAWVLHIADMQGIVRVFVNGRDAGQITPRDAWLDIRAYVDPGELVHLALFLERTTEAGAGSVIVYEGNRATNWRVTASEEEAIVADAEKEPLQSQAAALPYRLAPGKLAWLRAQVPVSPSAGGWRVKVEGSGLKLTIVFAGRIVSRLWLPGGAARPVMRGGDPHSFWLPGVWFEGREQPLALLLEAVDLDGECGIERLAFTPA